MYHTPSPLTKRDNGGTVAPMVSQQDFDALVARVEALEKSSQVPAVVGAPLPATSAKTKRGTRLPTPWQPAKETVEQMLAEFPTVTREEWVRETRKFCDYWHGVAGARGVKLDWEGTWRNWVRKAFERRHPAGDGGTTMSTVDAKAASYLDD